MRACCFTKDHVLFVAFVSSALGELEVFPSECWSFLLVSIAETS